MLLYFDHFSHPLEREEVFELLNPSAGYDTFLRAMEDLIARGYVGEESGYYFLMNGRSDIRERVEKVKKTKKYFRVAAWISRLIFWHPFVRAVFISGSLSKNAISRKDDIDFFVISESGRLWVSRFALMLFKKIFLLNSKKYFCINYFIDTESLIIPDHNIFTAVELAFMKPLQNPALYEKFIASNGWIRQYFPNKSFPADGCRDSRDPWFKRMIEYLLKGKAGDRLDSWFLTLYRKRARKKYSRQDPESFRLNFRSEKNVSKHHPSGYQQKILEDYGKKVREFGILHGIDLTLPQ